MYVIESNLITQIFISEMTSIHHIGSTAIPTIGYAKPIIDILVVVKDIEKIDLYNDKMSVNGYSVRNEQGIEGRRYFTKCGINRTHHVHIYQTGNINIQLHLNFKEFLLSHSDEAKKYGGLKLKLANQYPDDTHKYQIGKESFVNELVKKSIKWASSHK